jgi:hypothetical protein
MTPSLHGGEDHHENRQPQYFIANQQLHYAKEQESEIQHDMEDYETQIETQH